MTVVLTPQQTQPFLDPKTGIVTKVWYRFLSLLQSANGATIVASGSVALVGGTATVSNVNAATDNQIMLTPKIVSGSQGFLSIGAVVANTSFVINSSNALDTSTVSWAILASIGLT